MSSDDYPSAPSLPWRASSVFTMFTVGLLSRSFLYGSSFTQAYGLDRFLKLLDEREDIEGRRRGLITVSNHMSVLDDPMIWGVLPLRYLLNPDNMRWSMGSYDLCFKNKVLSTFFTLGQTLPTHRNAYSQYGSVFQPTVTQAIRLLSEGPFHKIQPTPSHPDSSLSSPDITDPFTSNHLTYTTTGKDLFPAPAAYASRRHAWIHIFPEGKVHQNPHKHMRYFKWGVSRLILESEPCPDVVPMWIEGPECVMPEFRTFPRFLPRPFQNISISFGAPVNIEVVFGDLRERWRILKEQEMTRLEKEGKNPELAMGELTERLKYGEEAEDLRIECTMRVRREVLKVRKRRGWPDEDPKAGWADTYRLEGPKSEGKMEDGSIVKDM